MTAFPLGIVGNAQPWTGLPAASISYTSTSSSTNNQSNYTFNNMSIGSADANRVIAVAIYAGLNGTATSVTIGGVSATKVVGVTGTVAEIWWASVPTGTTATVAISLSGSAGRCAVSAYRIIPGYSSTPYSSNSTAGVSTSQNEITGGASVFLSVRAGSSAYTMSRNSVALSTDQSSVYGGSNLVKVGNVSVSGNANFVASATYSADFNDGYIAIAHWR